MSIFNHLNKLKPFVPGLAGYGQMFVEIMYFNCLPHILVLVCWLKEMIFFSRGGRWISGYLLHQ